MVKKRAKIKIFISDIHKIYITAFTYLLYLFDIYMNVPENGFSDC